MNLPVKLPDTAAVDARGSRRPSASGSAGAADDAAASFDGVLSDAQASDAAPKSSPAPTSSSAPSASGDAPTASAGDPTLEALMGLVTQTQGGPASATLATSARGTKAADGDADPEESVDALLKRLSKKDEAKTPDAAAGPAGAVPPDVDPRLGALATLVAQIAPGAQQGAASKAPPNPPPAASSPVSSLATADSGADTAATTIVSDVATQTHLALAPAPRAQGRDTTRADVASAGATATTGLGAHDVDPAAPQPVAPTAAGKEGAAHKNAGSQADPDATTPGAAPDGVRTEALAAAPAMASDLGALRRIASAVVELAAAPAPTGPQVPDPDTTKATAPARTLTLQMQPADLGTVDVRLHMSADGLDLRLGLSDERTLGMVSRERDTLTSMLQDQNYQVHSLVIQDSGGSASTSGGGSGSNPNPSPHADGRADRQPGAAGSGDNSANQRQQQGDRPAQNGRQPRETSSLRTPADPGTSLFV